MIAVEEFVQWYEAQTEDIGGMAIIAAMAKMRHLVAQAKIPATLDYVDEFVEDTDRKICVFAHHKDVQEILYDELQKKYGDQMPVFQYTAEMNSEQRYETQEEFNKAPRCLMVASTQAAGEGLNLQTCADCILHERQWNPGKEEQAEGRFIRIGSVAKSVNATYAHMEGLTTIDPQLDGIVETKRRQYHAVMNTSEMPTWNEDAIIRELADSIVRAHNSKKNRKVLEGVRQ